MTNTKRSKDIETIWAMILVLALLAVLVSAESFTIDPVRAQSCAAESSAGKGSFGSSCDGTYPAACGTGAGNDLLSCNEGGIETHTYTKNKYGGVLISSFNTSVIDCLSIDSVIVCYEWWSSSTDVTDCDVSVDNDGDGSWVAIDTSCPGNSANPGVTCTDASSAEADWVCGNFFGPSGTRAQAKSELDSGGGGPAKTISYDVLFFNVTYSAADSDPPTIALNSPAHNAWDLDGNVEFNYTPSDADTVINCSITIDNLKNITTSPIVKDQKNSFNISQFTDGSHEWYVNCTDASDNVGNSVTRIIKIDTTPPTVNLEDPPDDNLSTESDVMFYFNSSDIMTTLDSCELVVDDTPTDSNNTPEEDVSTEFTATLTNGDHDWYINCTDANGFEGMSSVRNVSIFSLDPSAVPDKGSYFVGETVYVTGENWNSLVEITFNYTLSNGSIISHINTSTAGTMVYDVLYLNYSFPVGSYDLFAYQTSDLSENASTSFTVSLLPTTISTLRTSYPRGDQITMIGDDFVPNSLANVTIIYSDSSDESFTSATNSTGGFTSLLDLSYTAPLGLTNISSYDVNYPQMNASNNFTITDRIASVAVNGTVFGRDSPINISGKNYTRDGIVQITIFDNNSDDIGPSFPLNDSVDSIGEFWNIWNTGDTCNGVYRVEAVSLNHTILNATTYFNISEFILTYANTTITSGFTSSDSSAITISLVNQSDDQDETQTVGGGSGPTIYYELNFTNFFKQGINVDSVIWQVEHAETSGWSVAGPQWFDGSSYSSVACPDFSSSTSDVNQTCELSTYIDNRTELNYVSLRFRLSKTAGGSQTSNLDFTQLLITVSYQPTCTYFNGSTGGGLASGLPVITSVILDDSNPTPSDEIDLNAGTTHDVACNVTVQDEDGYTDIVGVNATLFSYAVSSGSPDNNTNHYTNTTCTFDSNSDPNTALYICGFSIEYYSQNGTWTCEATVRDSSDFDSNTDTATITPLYAINVSTDSIDYGDIPFETPSSDQELNITNIGNTLINISVRGFGGNDSVSGDGFSMLCIGNNITVSAERFAMSTGIPYASKTQLSSTAQDMGFQLIGQDSEVQFSLNSSYWQMSVPYVVPEIQKGFCNGTLVLQAEAP